MSPRFLSSCSYSSGVLSARSLHFTDDMTPHLAMGSPSWLGSPGSPHKWRELGCLEELKKLMEKYGKMLKHDGFYSTELVSLQSFSRQFLLKTAARGQKMESYTSWGYNGPRSFPLDLQFRHDQAGSLSFSEDVKHWPSWAKIHRFQGPHPYRHVKPRHVCLQAISREDGTQPTNILQFDPIGIFLSGCCFSLADAVLDWPHFTLWCAWEGSWVPGSYNENQ